MGTLKERVQILLNEAQQIGTVISQWEMGFLESVMRQLDNNRALSSKQVDIIHRAEAKVEKVKKGDPAWEAEWNDEKAYAWKVAVDYYNAGSERYYSQILDWALSNSNCIPPQDFYKKIVENKYAQKIIKGLTTEPKYLAGSAVMLRAIARDSLPYLEFRHFKEKMLFVIEPTNRAVSAAQGCRIYSLLASDSAKILEVEERYIKKYRKSSKKSKSLYKDIPF